MHERASQVHQRHAGRLGHALQGGDAWGLHYQHAHQIALRAEEAAVRAAGIEWRDYDRFMQQWIKRADSNKITKVPADLDLTPYLDENETELIKAMQKAMVGNK